MKAVGAAAFITFLAVSGCARQDAPEDITALLRGQGFAYLDIEPRVTISPLCSMRVGPTRYDFYWYEWWQKKPVGVRHAAGRLIQIRDGRIYDGHYGALPPGERPHCRPDRRQIIFGSSFIGVGPGGLPESIFADGAFHERAR